MMLVLIGGIYYNHNSGAGSILTYMLGELFL